MTSFGTELHYSDNSSADFSISLSRDLSPLIYFQPLSLSLSHSHIHTHWPRPLSISPALLLPRELWEQLHTSSCPFCRPPLPPHTPPSQSPTPPRSHKPPAACDIKYSIGAMRDAVSLGLISAVRWASVTVSTPVCC